MNIEAQAVAAFPELQRLVDLREAGWTFLPSTVDGEITEVHGVRTWSGGWADAVRIRYTTDVAGVRADHDGGVVWRREGTLTEVVDELITLPPPGSPGAPRLVKGQLWKPR